MNALAQGRCPRCQAVLRIPEPWLHQLLRCRHCGAIVRPRGTRVAATVPDGNTVAPAPGMTAPPVHGVGDPITRMPPVDVAVGGAGGSPLVTSISYVRRRPRGSPLRTAVVWLLALGLLAGGLYLFNQYYPLAPLLVKNDRAAQPNDQNNAATQESKGSEGKNVARTAPATFPRRLLVLNIDNYLFLNPLTSSPKGQGDRIRAAAQRWAFEWHIPLDKDNSQVFVLSDTLPERSIPVKDVLQGTYVSFFQTSRAQDRIVVYFSGHALWRDGSAYLAPLEADPDDPNTLIPLSDFYEHLKNCRATQKVVIWDVCRYNPERGQLRPGSEPMSNELFQALQAAPAGVEVILTCGPGENALEFSSVTLEGGPRPQTYAGSAFLIAARLAAERRKGTVQPPAPEDPLPVSEWIATVQQRLNELLETVRAEKKQTVHQHGSRPPTLVAVNPQEPPAQRVVFPPPPRTASAAEVAGIVSEFILPPLKEDAGAAEMAGFPFDPQVLAAYRDPISIEEVQKNPEQYRLRATVLRAFKEIRDIWQGDPASGGTGQLPDTIKAPITDELKKTIFAGLDFYAEGIARLELVDADLDALEAMRNSESRRWQAHYDYARAAVKTRLAFLNEYNKVMGNVRTNTLPMLDPKLGQNQYKLASTNRLRSGKEVERMVEQARQIYGRIVQEHKGTPWAIQAKREKNLSLGLTWQPSSDKKADDD
ncbi:MAG: hypothetical protein NZU63_13085 [Gemmataceae bacterium]|nr:hypothetical protein [Gemmataceae bacterium]